MKKIDYLTQIIAKHMFQDELIEGEISHLTSDSNIPENVQVSCGIVTLNSTKNPWAIKFMHVRRFSYGFGAIINARMVLSAAAIFWNQEKQKSYNLSEYYAEITRDNIIQQEIELERIAYTPNRRTIIENPPSGNIVVVVLRTSIGFQSSVVPICLSFELYADGVFPTSFKGRTLEQGDIELQLPINCYSELSLLDKPPVTNDVLCSGLLKGPRTLVAGSGFAIPIEKNGSEIFYLLGIQTWFDTYDERGTYYDFQNVLFYKDFIQREISYMNEKQITNTSASLSIADQKDYFVIESSYSSKSPAMECSSACGIITQNVSTSPWNVAVVYSPTNARFFGTIITARMILSVAYYFWNRTEQRTNDLSNYYVNIVRDNIIHQRIDIKRIVYPPNHQKLVKTPPSGNIIIVVLNTSIEFTADVFPICLPFELHGDDVSPSRFKGRTPDEENVELHLPTHCYPEMNSTEKPLVAIDVLCTNLLKLSNRKISEGSGFAFPVEKNGTELFYFLGVRTWWRDGNNENGIYFMFQNVLFYKDFIQREMFYGNENQCKTENSSTLSSFSNNYYCRVDNIPVRGNAYYESNDQKIEFGQIIQHSASIVYRCIQNHVLEGISINYCLDGEWIYAAPECKPRCNPNDIQGWTLVAYCHFLDGKTLLQTSCTLPATPGTVASIKCKLGYERRGSYEQIAICRSDGRWDTLPERCTPICGEISQGTAYVVGGQITDASKVPWHAGIYRKHIVSHESKQICGGSIITSKVIVTAIHCFWDPSNNRLHNKEKFDVAVGKSRRQLSEAEKFKAQFFKIENIFYIEGYNDYGGNYANDIAIAILNNFIDFKSYIAPVCIQFGLEYDEKIVEPGLLGKVAGWGLNETSGYPSPVLKEIELPIVSRKDCEEHSSKEFRQFITSDKFCAGYITGRSICEGDSGGGLVIPQTIGIKTVYYLRGIVSTGANNQGSCYTTFTNVAYYTDFIKKYYSSTEHQPNL